MGTSDGCQAVDVVIRGANALAARPQIKETENKDKKYKNIIYTYEKRESKSEIKKKYIKSIFVFRNSSYSVTVETLRYFLQTDCNNFFENNKNTIHLIRKVWSYEINIRFH